MNISYRQNSILQSISIQNITSYLNQKGWISDTGQTLEKLYVFKGPIADSGEVIELRVPKSSAYVDFYDRIADAVNLLSIVEGVSPEQIILDIKSCYLDTINIRVLETGSFSDSLAIEDAYKNITGLRNLIIYAASSENTPSKHFDHPNSAGQRHSRHCRFGHTYRGSFGFTVESPLMQNQNENHDILTAPFERRVVERVAKGLEITNRASRDSNPDLLVESYESAFNSRMCEALLQFSNTSVEMSIDWFDGISLSEEIEREKKYVLDRDDFEVLQYAANKLKEVEPVEKTIVGNIINLHCVKNPDEGQNNRSIVVKFTEDNKSIDVKATLNSTNYVDACLAHAEGKIISISGHLQRTGSQWEITNISRFEFL